MTIYFENLITELHILYIINMHVKFCLKINNHVINQIFNF